MGRRKPKPASEANPVRLNPARHSEAAAAIEKRLRSLVVSQDEAVNAIVAAYEAHLAGLNPPGRPISNMLFLGPTGTGKTRCVEALAECTVGDTNAVVKVNCAEFSNGHEVAKLVGSPPGYLGHGETRGMFSQDNLNRYWTADYRISFVLFDEIEKANDKLWNLLLGVLDKGTLTMGNNRQTDFSRCMIFMTSNLGAREMQKQARGALGFAGSTKPAGNIGLDAARKRFTPEFMNRLDHVVTFKELTPADIRKILDIELHAVYLRVMTSTGAILEFTDAAKEHLLVLADERTTGARGIKRAIEREIVQPMARLVSSGQVGIGDQITVDREVAWLAFDKQPAKKLAGVA